MRKDLNSGCESSSGCSSSANFFRSSWASGLRLCKEEDVGLIDVDKHGLDNILVCGFELQGPLHWDCEPDSYDAHPLRLAEMLSLSLHLAQNPSDAALQKLPGIAVFENVFPDEPCLRVVLQQVVGFMDQSIKQIFRWDLEESRSSQRDKSREVGGVMGAPGTDVLFLDLNCEILTIAVSYQPCTGTEGPNVNAEGAVVRENCEHAACRNGET